MTNVKPFCVDCDVQITHAGQTQEVKSHLNQEFTDNYHQAPHVINLTIYTLHLKNKVTKVHVLKKIKQHNALTLGSYTSTKMVLHKYVEKKSPCKGVFVYLAQTRNVSLKNH